MAIWIIVSLFLLFGFLGCFINKVPGPICVVIAVVVAKAGASLPVSWGIVALIAVLAIASMVASKMLVKAVKSVQQYSKRATVGTTIGSIIGLLVMLAVKSKSTGVLIAVAVIGLVVIPFVMAYLLEMTNKERKDPVMKCATAATSAYLCDTFLKLVVFVLALYMVFDSMVH